MLASISLDPPQTLSTHLVQEDGYYYIDTTGGVLLGKMSFKMKSDKFDIKKFNVKSAENAPKEGTRIIVKVDKITDLATYYQGKDINGKNIIEFIDETASTNANLSSLKLSTGTKNTENPEENTYKEYNLTPNFDKNETNYELTLMEYLDNMNITAVAEDTKAKMKIKVPKRKVEKEGEVTPEYNYKDSILEYDSENNIVYEEKEITSNTPLEIQLNKLGEPDTVLTIIVTAEDGSKKEYSVTIKRPYGILKGSITTAGTKNIATIRLYKTEEVSKVVNWDQIVQGKQDNLHEQLLTIPSYDVETNEDGTYEIYIIPDTYDILIDKPGYLDYICRAKQIQNNNTVELENKSLTARRCK